MTAGAMTRQQYVAWERHMRWEGWERVTPAMARRLFRYGRHVIEDRSNSDWVRVRPGDVYQLAGRSEAHPGSPAPALRALPSPRQARSARSQPPEDVRPFLIGLAELIANEALRRVTVGPGT